MADAPQIGFTEARFIDSRPDTSTARAIGAIGDVVKEVRVGKFQEELEESADRIREFAQADKNDIRFSSLRKDIIDTKLFGTFRKALDQNKSTEAAALIAAEAEVKRLINKNPGFAPDIRKLARDTLGLDPLGSKFKFGIEDLQDTATKTEIGREVANVREEMRLSGASQVQTESAVNQVLRISRLNRGLDETEALIATGQAKIPEHTDKFLGIAHTWSEDFQVRTSLVIQEFKGQETIDLATSSKLNEEINVQQQAAIRQFDESLAAAGIEIDPTERDARVATFSKVYDNAREFVNDRDFLAIAENISKVQELNLGLTVAELIPGFVAIQKVFPGEAVAIYTMLGNPKSPLHKALLSRNATVRALKGSDQVVAMMNEIESSLNNMITEPGKVSKSANDIVNATLANLKRRGNPQEETIEKLYQAIISKNVAEGKAGGFHLKYIASIFNMNEIGKLEQGIVFNSEASTEGEVKKLAAAANKAGLVVDLDNEGNFTFTSVRADEPANISPLINEAAIRNMASFLGFPSEEVEGTELPSVVNFFKPLLKVSDNPLYRKAFPKGKQGYIRKIQDALVDEVGGARTEGSGSVGAEAVDDLTVNVLPTEKVKPLPTKNGREVSPTTLEPGRYERKNGTQVDVEIGPSGQKIVIEVDSFEEANLTKPTEGDLAQLDDGTLAIVRNGKLVKPTAQDLQVIG